MNKMNQKNLKSLFWISLILVLFLILMFILFIVYCLPDCDEENKFRTMVLGISLILLTLGLMTILVIYFIATLKALSKLPNEEEIRRNKQRESDLDTQTKARIDRESQRQWINDYFRLVEFSKDTTKKAELLSEGDKTRIIESKEVINLVTLNKLVEHYNEQIDKHITPKKDV